MLASRLMLPRSIGAARFFSTFLALPAVLMLAAAASAGLLVHDTWQDGERYEPAGAAFVPAPPPYAENNGVTGTDADSDGDLESAWFRGGSGTWDPVTTGGPLRGTTSGTSSASWTTYFTDDEGDEVNLANVGDKLCITWDFTLDGVNTSNTSQAFRLAVVDSPSNRLTANGSPGSADYTGYGLFGNIGQTFGHSRPWDLMTRNAGSSALLSSSSSWASAGVQDGTNGNAGYANGVDYEFTFMAEHVAGDGLQVSMRLDGQVSTARTT